MNNIKYIIPGIFFGFVLVKSEVVSWFRIQEMFRFDSFHMYGIFATAILTAAISIQVIKRLNLKDINGQPIRLFDKDSGQVKRYLAGGTLFGFGWAMTGACPGPMFTLAGAGYGIFIIPIISAIIGTWIYGKFREKLPH